MDLLHRIFEEGTRTKGTDQVVEKLLGKYGFLLRGIRGLGGAVQAVSVEDGVLRFRALVPDEGVRDAIRREIAILDPEGCEVRAELILAVGE